LYGHETPPDVKSKNGDAYFEKGLFFDAVDFYARAVDKAGLKRIHGVAIKEGDAFLLRKVQEAMPDLVSHGDWELLAASAERQGKAIYAQRATNGGTPPPPPLQDELTLDDAGEAETPDASPQESSGDGASSEDGA
jgi:hypothetical protein